MNAQPTTLSIVMATHNRRKMLEHVLPSFFAQDYDPSAYEVVLVIDGSIDGTREFVSSLRPDCAFEVVVQEHAGPAVARNAGIAAAGGEVVMLMDDDIRATPQLVAEHAAAHRDAGILRAQGSLFAAPESPPTLPAWSTREWYQQYDAALRRRGTTDPNWRPFLNANSSLPREVLVALGGFDETLPFPREDFELALRVAAAGIPSIYRPRALAYEVFVKRSQDFVRDAVGYGRAELAICRKHPQYRPDSALTPVDRPFRTPVREGLRRAVRRASPEWTQLLTPPMRVSEALGARPRPRNLGMKLLAIQHRAVLLHSALETAGSAAELRDEFERWLPVLLYHRVGVGSGGLHASLTVSPSEFERQIRWLVARGYTGISAGDWIEWREGRRTLPAKPVLITFDDAYADVARHALPLLREAGFPSLVFAVSRRLGAPNSWDAPPPNGELPQLMDAAEIAGWAGRGVALGAHGRTHRDLTTLSAEELRAEIFGSRDDLEELAQQPVDCFAYPYGTHDQASRELAEAAYSLAFTASEGLNGLATDPHLQRRLSISPVERLAELEWRLRFGRVPFSELRARVRLRARSAAVANTLRTPLASVGATRAGDHPRHQGEETA